MSTAPVAMSAEDSRPARQHTPLAKPPLAQQLTGAQPRRRWLLTMATAALAMGLASSAQATFPRSVEQGDLNGRNGFQIVGTQAADFFGSSVSSAGDVNGDGLPDLIVGAPFTDSDTGSNVGISYVLFGRRGGFPALLNAASLDGSNGFRIEGVQPDLVTGVGVVGLDINGDGLGDLVMVPGRVFGDSISGRPTPIYVVYGSRDGFPAAVSLDGLDGTNGFRILSEVVGNPALQEWNFRVGRAGDLNGDGLDDLVIGQHVNGTTRLNPGRAYVVYGSRTGFPATLQLADLDGTNGFRLDRGTPDFDSFGRSVGAAGDINGDGLDDLIIGASGASSPRLLGQAYVLFGNSDGFPARVQMSSLDGSNGLSLYGSGGQMGFSVNGAGDINGDGLDDIIIGNPTALTFFNRDSGSATVLFGSDQGFPTDASGNMDIELAAEAGRGVRVLSVTGNLEELGSAVSGAGDVNGDGIDDFIVGAPGTSGQNGAAHVVFGTTGEFPVDILASSRIFNGLDGSNGFSVWPVFNENFFGNAVSRLGDFNGDGVDDIVIGARSSGQSVGNPGRAIVVFGGLTGPGEVPVAGLSQTSLDFGNVLLGQTSPAQTVTLQNIGYVHALVLGPLALSGADAGDFSLSNDSCSNQTLAQDATCSFDIALTPGGTGARSALVDIPSNAPLGPDVVTLDGVGEALPEAVFRDGFEGD